jgi:signal transduction histidine kinase
MADSYPSLIRHIHDLEEEATHLRARQRKAEKDAAVLRQQVEALRLQAKTSQTLNLGLFTVLESGQIFSLVCESLVVQIGWDWAMALSLHGKKATVHAHYGMATKQLNHVRDYIGLEAAFIQSYSEHAAVSTLPTHTQPPRADKQSLALRSMFQAEEIIAMPVLFGDRLFAYLVAGTNRPRPGLSTPEDLDYFAGLAAQVGHALENTGNYLSLEEQNQRLRHLDELKDSFISITSHQLRTPLSIVKWILSILIADDQVKKMTEQYKLVSQAYESNERLIHVVNDLLNVSRLQEGRLPYSPQPTDLRQVVEDLRSNAHTACTNRELRLELDLPPQLPVVSLDPIIFREAMQNLLDNALDYNIPNGFVRLSAGIRDGKAFIAIANSGMGIPPDEQKHMYDQFYRSPEAVKMQPSGNGLGLYLTRAIVQQHGGEILCDSAPGQDTTFTVLLPIEAAPK